MKQQHEIVRNQQSANQRLAIIGSRWESGNFVDAAAVIGEMSLLEGGFPWNDPDRDAPFDLGLVHEKIDDHRYHEIGDCLQLRRILAASTAIAAPL